MENTRADRKLLTCPQIAEILQVSESFAYKLVKSGELPGVRIGRSIRVKSADLWRYIEANSASKGEIS